MQDRDHRQHHKTEGKTGWQFARCRRGRAFWKRWTARRGGSAKATSEQARKTIWNQPLPVCNKNGSRNEPPSPWTVPCSLLPVAQHKQ
uniref:Uncharacterized protein n=1 Tax=Anopheles dirus TaxID=7168 RepID=A0A182NVS3_9DIPT